MVNNIITSFTSLELRLQMNRLRKRKPIFRDIIINYCFPTVFRYFQIFLFFNTHISGSHCQSAVLLVVFFYRFGTLGFGLALLRVRNRIANRIGSSNWKLSDTRTRYLGSRAVKLFRVRMQGSEL